MLRDETEAVGVGSNTWLVWSVEAWRSVERQEYRRVLTLLGRGHAEQGIALRDA